MAKITRKTAAIFGGANVAGPGGIGIFGSLAGGTPDYSLDPAVIQASGPWVQGWGSALVSLFPAQEDLNSVDYVNSYNNAYLLQQGIAEYDAGTTYYTNSFCSFGNLIYISLGDGNIGHQPDTHPENWAVYGSANFYGVMTTTGGLGEFVATIAGLTALVPGMTFNLFVQNQPPDISPTLNINGTGIFPVTDSFLNTGVDGIINILRKNSVVSLVFDGTEFVIQGSNVLATQTFFYTATGTANAIVLALPLEDFSIGTIFNFVAIHNNTAATTLGVGTPSSVLALKNKDGSAMSGGEIVAGTVYSAILVQLPGPTDVFYLL